MTLPPFAIAGGLPLALVRGLSVAGLFTVFGAALARVAVMPPALDRAGPEALTALRRWRNLIGSSLVVAVLAFAAWTWLIAGTLADTPTLAGVAATAWTLLRATAYGHAVLLQLAALGLVALALARRLHRIAAGLAAIAVVLQAAHGHAFAMDPGPSWLLLSTGLHLLAGAAWLGGLLPLLIVVQSVPVPAAALACRRFAPLGTACVLVLAATAGFQVWVLIGGLPRLLGTAYGLVALVKITLFAILLGFAVTNRLRLTPALAGDAPEQARRRMRRSLAGEAAIGLLVVLTAGVLASLPPSMHVQPRACWCTATAR
jgi:putative copper export protein